MLSLKKNSKWNHKNWGHFFLFKINPYYKLAWDDTRFLLSPDAEPRPIYVFGDPIYMYLSKRKYAIPIQGGLWNICVNLQWEELPILLEKASPPYIFIKDGHYSLLLDTHSPQTKKWIEENYGQFRQSPLGKWYKHK